MPDRPARGLFVTGTDTGVGKTLVSAALLAAMATEGRAVAAHKPVVTGLAPENAPAWPPDHELLALAAGMRAADVAPHRFEQPLSPHLAAELAGRPLDRAELLEEARAAAGAAQRRGATLIVEGVGGLLVPLAAGGFTVRELACALALPLIVAARPGLGTINHSLLTIDAARAAGLQVRAVVLMPWPPEPSAMERSNRDTVRELGGVEVAGLPPIATPSVAALAAAGAALPWRRWLSAPRHRAGKPEYGSDPSGIT